MKSLLIKILKKNYITYIVSLKIYEGIRHIKYVFDKIIYKKQVVSRLHNQKKIDFKILYYGKLNNSEKAINMKKLLELQIKKFKETGQKKFIFLEIGNYMGESLELFGDILQKNFDDFLIISIDSYSKFASAEDIKKKNVNYEMSKKIEKIYLYFLNNISLKSWRENSIHIRKNSKNGMKLLKNLNILFDFIYIDGSHYYDDIKHDFLGSKELIKNKNDYEGMICGDDYELDVKECGKYGYNENEFKNFLISKKREDYIIMEKKKGLGFHPGITLFFSEINENIFKTPSGLWHLKN